MDPPAAALHHPQLQQHSQDPASYIFQQAQYALQHHQPADEWSPADFQSPAHSHHSHIADHTPARTTKPKPYARPAPNARLTRNRAAALARQVEVEDGQDQQHQEQLEHHQPPPLQSYPPPYTPSGYLNTPDEHEPAIPLDGDASGGGQQYATPSSVYQHQFHLNFPADSPTSPSPPNTNGPNHPPLHPQQIGLPQHSPLGFTTNDGYHPQMLAPGRVDSYGLDDTATAYGSSGMSRGTEIMRVPSASPSIASGELGSPGPDDYPPFDPQTRSSSSHYDYSGSGGPISPLSSSYAPQALPSTFSSVTGGYLHGPPSQTQLPSASFPASTTAVDPDPQPTSASSRGRAGQKSKTKLTDMDRKFICVFAQNHPKARQEDIATKFAVERSTVSKILKCKEKWMKVDFFSSEARVVKHRPSKFPELESTLIHHIRVRIAAREPVNDSFIKKTALELAQERGIGKDKFKASSGWVENFKHRHDLRKGGSWGAGSAAKYNAHHPAAIVGPSIDSDEQHGAGDGDYGGDGGHLVYAGDDVSGEYAEEE